MVKFVGTARALELGKQQPTPPIQMDLYLGLVVNSYSAKNERPLRLTSFSYLQYIAAL